MKVLKIYLNNLKEETWIKEMSKKGWLIDNIGLFYTFKEIDKKEHNLEMDYRTFSSSDEFDAYITLYEDFGWKHIAGNKSSGSQYFLHNSLDSQEGLFSDKVSQEFRIKRIRKRLREMLTIALVFFIITLSQKNITIDALLNPKSLYSTPGLWGMSGNDFWSAFLLETPFALFRGVLIYALPLMILIYIIFSYKVQVDYNKSLKKIN